MADITLSGEQRRIVDDFGSSQFVSAGAGSGKTRVVIEGIISALERGQVTVEQVLAITFTEKAAGQMIKRARDRLAAKGMLEERRRIESAQISTIHGFCSSLIRANALALELDPGFAVADEAHATLLKERAFTRCLEGFLEKHGDAAVELYSEFDPHRNGELGSAIIDLHDELRSRGEEQPDLDLSGLDAEKVTREFRAILQEALEVFDASGSGATEKVKVPLQELLQVFDEPDRQKRLRAVFGAWPHARGIKGHIDELRRLRKRYLGLLFLDKLELLRRLLVAFTGEYAAVKRSASLLDFEDLQLQALKLLRQDERLRRRIAAGYGLIVVDEFQDTNGLQYEIVDLLARDNVCFVGDENQSIYRFRHADVDLFREKHDRFEAAGLARPLTTNYRSQPEILAFINHVFGAGGMLGGPRYLEMESGAQPDGSGDSPRVEAIIVDAGSDGGRGRKVEVTRPAEAELVARRLSELLDAGLGYEPGDCAILVRKRRDANLFSEALDRHGIPNYLSIGNDYYRKLELGDALGLLRLLVNPLDDIALLSVLRSPLVGLGDDTLIMLRNIAGSGGGSSDPPPLWPTTSSRRTLDRLPPEQSQRLGDFVGEFGRLRRRSRRQSLESTVREVIDYRDYAAIAAIGGDGRTALANLMKLIDLAVAYEEAWGRDLAAFVDFLAHQRDKEVRESEAPTQEEGSTSVQIMTIHSAKGLEFPLVVWGFMGDGSQHTGGKILVDKEGGIGFRYSSPWSQRKGDDKLLDYEVIEAIDREKELEEDKRVGYVAMTRAERHLILCGRARCLKEPGGPESRMPMEWVRDALGLGPGNQLLEQLVDDAANTAGAVVDTIKGCPVRLTVCNDPVALLQEDAVAGRGRGWTGTGTLPDDIGEMPAAAVFVPATINASSISVYRKCPRRYYLEKQVRIEPAGPAGAQADAGREDDQLPPNQMGTLVHAVLEHATISPDVGIDGSRENLDAVAAQVLGTQVRLSENDYERAARLLGGFRQAPVAAAMMQAEARGELSRERRFLTMLGETTILSGTMDVYCRGADGALVVDYKTDRIEDEAQLRDAAAYHAGQMQAYALAAARMQPGAPVQVALLFLDLPGGQVSKTYTAEELEAVEHELSNTIASMAGGDFPSLTAIDPDFCPGCAGFAGDSPLCATAAAARRRR